MIGESVGHYKIVDKLGSGQMGVVYKAIDSRLGLPAAVKLLPPDLAKDYQALERFQREAKLTSSLDHPHICKIYETGEHAGQPYIAMELLEGQTLNELVRGTPLPLKQLLELSVQVADALSAAHKKGIIHRDVKPHNIFVTKRGAKVVDFGAAKMMTTSDHTVGPGALSGTRLSTAPGIALGTLAYMSPEQARAEPLDVRTDLFSFGLVLYEMATGRPAFAGGNAAIIFDAVLNRQPPPVLTTNPRLPAGLNDVITRALEKDRKMRYQTAADMLADLSRLTRDAG